MPIYEYQCEACSHQMEVMQSIKDDPLVRCPACQADRLRKLVSAAGFRLKGSGWYVTDFRDGGKKKEGASAAKDTSEASAGEAGSKPASSVDAAPATSAETTTTPKPASGGSASSATSSSSGSGSTRSSGSSGSSGSSSSGD